MANLSRHVAIAGLAGLLAACAASSSEWQERLTVLPAAGDRLIGERLIDAQYVVAGRLEHVERADLYEPHGGWLMRMLFHDQGAPEAYEAKIQVDSVLKGGGAEVGRWATDHGFRLPPAAPEVLDFYAARSPIFLAAVFDADAAKARGQRIGDGTPVHITIPTANPWVPLRILALGKNGEDRIDADVYLLTDQRPALLPYPFANGMRLDHSAPATVSLLTDLRSDKGMDWIPQSGWLTKVAIEASASQLTYDLAVDVKGASPSRVAAGLEAPASAPAPSKPNADTVALVGIALAALGAIVLLRRSQTVSA